VGFVTALLLAGLLLAALLVRQTPARQLSMAS
jgi:hypothetical protein